MLSAVYKNAAILIVDDQQANLDLLESLLEHDDYTNVRTVKDARQVIDVFQAFQPDLILLDLHMPYLDGFEVMRQLRNIVPAETYLPILVLTADSTSAVKQRALAEGAKDFLTKPLDIVEALLRIKNLLETRMLHAQLRERNLVLEESMHELATEREQAERLLRNILPTSIANRLKREEGIIADSFPEATVLFADIVNFSSIAALLSPNVLVAWLNDVFSTLDRLAEKYGLEKIKTIGDAYMVVGGLPTPRPDHVEAVAEFALAARDEMALQTSPNGDPVQLRIGMHTGEVVAGVIGRRKFSYDLWGETVNIASRMESHGLDGAIQITAAAAARLERRYLLERRGLVELKHQASMPTYLLLGRL